MNGDLSLDQLVQRMRDVGATSLYAKRMAENDNSKNQVYLGPDFSALNVLPVGAIQADEENPQILKAPIELWWLREGLAPSRAPDAQLILYPQYPEVRMGSLLQGSTGSHSDLIRERIAGRVLFFGVVGDRVFAYVTAPESNVAHEFEKRVGQLRKTGVFVEIPTTAVDPREGLLASLSGILAMGWVDSQRMLKDGTIQVGCDSPNCGGYTLEALLGVRPTGAPEPDFQGWEIKTHSVTTFAAPPSSAAVTLMTPEPTGGFYSTASPEEFLRKYGYPDPVRDDRINFSGRHLECSPSPRTRLHMVLEGFDRDTGKITDSSGGIVLRDQEGHPAAVWQYASLLTHWNRKHAFAAYVGSCRRSAPHRQYRFGAVRLGEGTDFELFLKALAERRVYYDPGLKLENASDPDARAKRRSQFRVAARHLPTLYHSWTSDAI